MDHNFKDIGDEKYWQNIIDKFYDKYKGLSKWHKDIVDTVKKQFYLEMPTGRRYDYKPEVNSMGNVKFPRTRILNYPVQGLGADLMSIARVSIANRLRGKQNVDLINTVHDSVMIDFDDTKNDSDELVSIVEQAFHDIPANFYRLFGSKFNLPTRVDIQVGNHWGEMK
jgi:DNA polymerase I-like protein with 3'-5' exonuclease and polymerase domains